MSTSNVCQHLKLFDGRCIECGKALSRIELENYIYDGPSSYRNMVLKDEAKNRKGSDEKLSILLDLDNTCVHSLILRPNDYIAVPSSIKVITEIERREKRRPKDEDDCVNLMGFKNNAAFVKIKPGLIAVIEELAKYFKIGIFSLGSTDYALALRDLIDPGHSLIELGVYTRDDCDKTGVKDVKKLFEIAPNNILIWDDTSIVWPGHGQLLKCEAWSWKKYKILRVFDESNKNNHYAHFPYSLICPPMPSPPIPPSLLTKQRFWPCIYRPIIYDWVCTEQMNVMKKVFKEVNETAKVTHKSTSSVLMEIRRKLFNGLTFAYDKEYLNDIKRIYSKYECFSINEYELTLMIRSYGGRVVPDDSPEAWLISNYQIEDRICVPPSWVFYSTLLMRRIPSSLITINGRKGCVGF